LSHDRLAHEGHRSRLVGTHVLGNAVGNYGLSDQPHTMFSRVVGTGAQGIAGG
jgi:hypothetical protein